MIGIYKIHNKINDKVYIGQTINFNHRLYLHLHYLNTHRHSNSHLQKSWDKYGSENFEIILFEDLTDELQTESRDRISDVLNTQEKFWIKYYKSSNPEYGYNLSEGGDGSTLFGERNPSFGKSKSDEVRQKISNTIRKNKSHSGERNGRFGKPVSDEVKAKISKANKGRKQSDEERARRCEIMKDVVNRPENVRRREERKLDPVRRQKWHEQCRQRRRYTEEFVAKLREEYKTDKDIPVLACKYNIPNKTCMEIVHRNGHFKHR